MSGAATQALLRKAFPPSKAQTIFTERIHHRPLRFQGTTVTARELRRLERLRQQQQRKLHRRTCRKTKPLTAREKRALHIHDIPAEARKYELYEPLHRLWVGYMQEVLHGFAVTQAQVGLRLASADYHGAVLEVVRSRCPSRVGVCGICVKETRCMFYIITKDDVLKEIPKEHTVFRFEIPVANPQAVDNGAAPGSAGAASTGTGGASTGTGEAVPETLAGQKPRTMVFELHGSQFMYQAANRVGRKFKQKPITDL